MTPEPSPHLIELNEDTPPLQAFAFHQANGVILPDEEFWPHFRECWLLHDRLSEFQPDIRALLTKNRLNETRAYAMSQAEEDWFMTRIRRRKPLRVYRGCTQVNVAGFSWTTDAKIARAYARRAADPLMVIGNLNLRDMILRIEERGEKEIVCFPEHIFNARIERVTE